jgi:mono/diheme cytochrome c family protein
MEAWNLQGRAAIISGSSAIRLKVFTAILAGCFCIGLSGCAGDWNVPPAAKGVENPVPATPEALADARKIYLDRCAHCHGVNGDGKRPPGSIYLYFTQPTKFTDGKIMDVMTDGEIFWKITTGNRPMPSYRSQLSDKDRWELVDYLRTFARANALEKSSQAH